MMPRVIPFLLLLSSVAALRVYPHGTTYSIIRSRRVTIRAAYDSGEPMADADVLVFPPGAAQAARKTQTDPRGVFHFTPDRPGSWTLQVRDRSGHGLRINLDINEDLTTGASPSAAGLTWPQKLIMAVCVVWGCVATALFFKRRS